MRGAVAAAGIALAVYLRTLLPGIPAIDGGELAAVAARLGIAHPSGYPLYSCLGRVWVLLAPVRVITWMNALSAVLAAGAVLLLYRTVHDVLPERAGKWRAVGAWTAAMAFAFHGTLWSMATVTEVHALQMFLDAALLHAVVRAGLWGGGALGEKACVAGGYLSGLALTNHLTAAMLLPGIALSAWRRRASIRRGLLLAVAGAFLLGLSAYAFLPIRSAQDPVLDWGSPRTVETILRHVSGAQYRVWIFASGETLERNLPQLGAALARFSWPLLALAAWGLWTARRIRGVLPGTVTMFVLSAGYPLGYGIPDIETYFLAPVLVAAVWIGVGAADVAMRVARSARAARLAPAVALLPAVPLITGWSAADRSRDTTVEAMARAFLATPALDSVVLNRYWDVLMAPALYLQLVEGVRTDVTVLDQEHFRRSWMVPWLRRHRPELLAGIETEADTLERLVLRFERDEPYEVDAIQAAFEAMLDGLLAAGRSRGGAYVTQEVEPGIGAAWARVPDGLLFRLEDPAVPLSPGVAPWPDLPPAERGPVAAGARGYAARMAAFSAMAAAAAGDSARAASDLARALAWNPDDPVARSAESGLRSGTP